MASSTTTTPRVLPAHTPIFGFFDRLTRAFERRQNQSRIAGELMQMSRRELADLGLSPSDIPDVARGTYRRD